MKKLIVSSLLVVAGLFGNNMQAQNSEMSNQRHHKGQKDMSPEERVRKETDEATLKLSLSTEQKVKWEAASLERIHANLPLKEKMQGSTTPEERKSLKTQMKTNTQTFDTNVQGFLTSDQKNKYETLKKERHDKKKGHHKGM